MPFGTQTMKASLLAFVRSRYALLFFGVLLLDLITKQWATLTQVNVPVIDGFFHLAYSRNTGAAWSILAGNQWILAIISTLVGVGFGYVYLKSFQQTTVWNHVGITLFLSGTWGNWVDRTFFPEGVIDFLSFRFGTYIFPTFNVADSALTIGVIVLIVATLFEKKSS